jgi:hypothetical protein
MKTRIAHGLRRLTRRAAGCLLGGALMVPMAGGLTVPMGPTTTSQAVNQINSLATRPMTSPPAGTAFDENAIWVPDRMVSVPVPGTGTVFVPGHWERRLDAHKVLVPDLTVRNPQTGVTTTFPAGTYPPVEERVIP